jgi:hypothetical protein
MSDKNQNPPVRRIDLGQNPEDASHVRKQTPDQLQERKQQGWNWRDSYNPPGKKQ